MKKLVVAFYRSEDPNGPMTKLNECSDWMYGEKTFIHCAIIVREGYAQKEFTYHLDKGGPRREEGRTFGGTTMNTGWSTFKSIPVSPENYDKCQKWLTNYYEKYLSVEFDEYDPFMQWGMRIYAPRLVGLLESIATVSGCLPEKRWTYCAGFVASALKKAGVSCFAGRDTETISTQDLYKLLETYPDCGPEDMEILKKIK